MLESGFQKEVIDDVRDMFPGCIILKNDPTYLQGIPDLVIFYYDRYAFLEVKQRTPKKSDYRPNQEWYLDIFNEWSFGSMICPENQEEVYSALQQTLRSPR